MKLTLAILVIFIITGCAVMPHEEISLDTTSNFKMPEKGKVGLYIFQWKSGVFGAISDVDFELKDGPRISLNTGEYGYIEVSPGDYQYKTLGGPSPQYAKLKLEANRNYFFRSYLSYGMDTSSIVTNQNEINDAKRNIFSGRYELNSVD